MRLTILKLIRLERAESHLESGWPRGALASLAATSNALRRELPSDILAVYDRLSGRGLEAVVAVRTGVCQGCRLRLSRASLARLRDSEEIVRCEYCGRFLYVSEDPAVESQVEGSMTNDEQA